MDCRVKPGNRLLEPALSGCAPMAAFDEDDRPKKKIVHEIGQDLTLISVAELNERIALLREEISRLESDIAKKTASRASADAFFKK